MINLVVCYQHEIAANLSGDPLGRTASDPLMLGQRHRIACRTGPTNIHLTTLGDQFGIGREIADHVKIKRPEDRCWYLDQSIAPVDHVVPIEDDRQRSDLSLAFVGGNQQVLIVHDGTEA